MQKDEEIKIFWYKFAATAHNVFIVFVVQNDIMKPTSRIIASGIHRQRSFAAMLAFSSLLWQDKC